MVVLLAFAFISGVITILSPCILPVLPIVLAGGSTGGKARPFGVISGFVVSFSFFTLALSAIVQALGVPADAMRYIAIGLIVLFGVVMLVPRLREGFDIAVSRIASRSGKGSAGRPAKPRIGFWSGIPVGLSLGLIWTPCVGPIMASVISLALTQKVDGGTIFVTLAYTVGTAIPMLAVMIGGRALIAKAPALSRNVGTIQRVFGAVMILMGVALAFQWDRQIQTAILRTFPSYGAGLTAVENLSPVKSALKARAVGAHQKTVVAENAVFSGAPDGGPETAMFGDYGTAPRFVATGNWFNTGAATPPGGIPAPSTPLDLAALRGKVVLVDFWTYSCINCIRTIPYLKSWYDSYKGKGLVIVGVHSPEFAFEKVSANVARAMRDLGVNWPVVQDNDYAQWRAYGNNYWPAHYFIDAKGRIRYWHFGEGGYAETEAVIKKLLAEAGASVDETLVSAPPVRLAAITPETYLGYERGKGFATAVKPEPDKAIAYRPSRVPASGEWNLKGTWTIAGQYVVPGAAGTLWLGFDAKDVYLVAAPAGDSGSIAAFVDGSPAADTKDLRGGMLRPDASRLYHIVALREGGPHVLKLEVKGSVRLFSFTFG
ncbi:MAG: cytochrome c biogenesis protein DipZ [Rectinemataceae bacterium]|jgi:cytochrome c biogenesis protein CcdA/thiol-disulfide isomerase/thioredoxin